MTVVRDTLAQLRQARDQTVDMARVREDRELQSPVSEQLSPIGWHVGHSAFVECYWLQEVVCGDSSSTRPLHDFYFPENIPRQARSAGLPTRSELLAWCDRMAERNDQCWSMVERGERHHPLLEDGYLPSFLLQHYQQHQETVYLISETAADPRTITWSHPVTSPAPMKASDMVSVAATQAAVGTQDHPAAYDNELPPQVVPLQSYRIASKPVTHSDWAAFIADAGYRQRDLWCDAGWQWRSDNNIGAPYSWRQAPDGWQVMGEPGDVSDQPVWGVSLHEARAYARWRGARLPHEHEWEHADRQGLLRNTGQAWEWCDNPLHPYPGFRAHPYDGYSVPWFDGRHFVLKGGSCHTQTAIRRSGFRNFYTADSRHVHAGLRLAA